MRFFQQLFLTTRFYILWAIVMTLFAFSFGFSILFPIAQISFAGLVLISVLDIVLLHLPSIKMASQRYHSRLLSLGDENKIKLKLLSTAPFPIKTKVIDELPYQLSIRDFETNLRLKAKEPQWIEYQVLPTKRGEYRWGHTICLIQTSIGLAERKVVTGKEEMVPVYPSIIQMKNAEIKALNKVSQYYGIKKMRRLGHSYEFEQIKTYVRGDDIRSINWKATGRRGGDLMVNQYEDEKSQQMYCIIDKSRSMKMPFQELSLVDYAINSSLALANIALRKQDKAGLITFSELVDTHVKADRGAHHLQLILEQLYHQETDFTEANYEWLYQHVKRFIKGRSLIMLYSNLESRYALERILPLLRRINQLHLLVIVFFKNTEVSQFAQSEVGSTLEVYQQGMARKYLAEKENLVKELSKYGIQAIYTKPEDLTVNSINKYLELKARGLI
jgi:uncharacterized protein (DUF58 family)